MLEIKKMVVDLLKSHTAKKRQIEQLRFELRKLATINEAEIISNLSLGSGSLSGRSIHGGHVSNRTMAIALRYQDTIEQMKNESVTDIMNELHALESETERLDRYVSLLDDMQGSVIRKYYFEKRSWDELEDDFHMHKRTLQIHRDNAINELVSMYSYIAKLSEQVSAGSTDNS